MSGARREVTRPIASRAWTDTAVVLRAWKLAEKDRILSLLTRGRGKIRAVARGARRPGSRFSGRLEIGSHVQVHLHAGRELATVTQVETIDLLRHTRADARRFAVACAMLEVADLFAHEREADEGLYRVLVGALKELEKRPSPLLLAGFALRVLTVEGLRPEVDACVRCGAEGPLTSLSAELGGAVCERCRMGGRCSPEAIAWIRRILSGGLAEALRLERSDLTDEVHRLAMSLLTHHLERVPRSLEALWLLENGKGTPQLPRDPEGR
ncbi:MAG: DNA repair protein RecO [Acidimicrobiales bacterium]|nr:MAG: DNA repair protein RecO [Acidimicrobiales bacterium]